MTPRACGDARSTSYPDFTSIIIIIIIITTTTTIVTMRIPYEVQVYTVVIFATIIFSIYNCFCCGCSLPTYSLPPFVCLLPTLAQFSPHPPIPAQSTHKISLLAVSTNIKVIKQEIHRCTPQPSMKTTVASCTHNQFSFPTHLPSQPPRRIHKIPINEILETNHPPTDTEAIHPQAENTHHANKNSAAVSSLTPLGL